VLTRWRTARLSAVVVLAAAVASIAGAQPVAECVRGDPRVPDGASADPVVAERLSRLAWRQSYPDYVAVLAIASPATVVDTIIGRAEALLGVVGPYPDSFDADTTLLFRRLGEIRTALATSPATSPISVERIPSFAHLRPAPDLVNPGVVVFVGGDPQRVNLSFEPTNPLPAIAICAAYWSTHRFLDHLQAPALDTTAREYARLSARWEEYVERGFSLTLVERLGHSCRLGPLNWVVATATAHRCGTDDLPPLGPPRARSIFVHPSAGVAPILADSSSFSAAAVVEWYGLLVHRYSDDGMETYGASVATVYPDDGAQRLGVMVHLSEIPFTSIPLPKIGIFEGVTGGGSSWRGRVFLTADVVGWVPGVRRSARELAVQPLVTRLARIARDGLTGGG
jgi:hypothetical protein